MKVFAVVAVISLAALAAAEPPSPRSNYLPPNQQQAGFNGNNGYNYNANDNSGYNYPSAPSSQYGAPSGAGANGGGAAGYNYADANAQPAKYSFEYDVQDYQSGNDFGHMESRDGDRTVGKYYVLLPDGRKQVVNYEADQNGYRPTITYEDTGAGQNGNGGPYPSSQQGGFQGYQ